MVISRALSEYIIFKYFLFQFYVAFFEQKKCKIAYYKNKLQPESNCAMDFGKYLNIPFL